MLLLAGAGRDIMTSLCQTKGQEKATLTSLLDLSVGGKRVFILSNKQLLYIFLRLNELVMSSPPKEKNETRAGHPPAGKYQDIVVVFLT